MKSHICPICKTSQFDDFRGRKNVRCAECGSFERSRYLWSILEKLKLNKVDGDILHIAPEVGIAEKLRKIYGDKYRTLDFEPEIYEKTNLVIEQIDLCKDLSKIKDNSVGAIIHVHVLEHVRCNVTTVFQELNRIIAPNGYHIFGLPFMEGYSKEDFNPELSEETRLRDYGHEDHVRVFGMEDWELLHESSFKGFNKIDSSHICNSKLLEEIRVPVAALRGKMSHSINVWRKTV